MAYLKEYPEVIAEKLNLVIDLQGLLIALEPLMLAHPPIQRSKAIGGWTIQSTNQSYTDGFSNEFCPYNGPNNKNPSWNPRNDSERGLPPIQEYKHPTELSCEPVLELIRKLEGLGFYPRKARILKLTAGAESVWHTDGSKKYYQVRLHVPLITNSGCLFETDHGKIHMPADGSAYLVKINQNHRVINHGPKDRFHIVMNVWDTKHFSEYNRFIESINLGESFHP